MDLQYMSGFGNHFESDSVGGVLPELGNTPQKVNRGLFAEQLSGSAFTMPREQNYRSWLYRIVPSAAHGMPEVTSVADWLSPPFSTETPPTQFRWSSIDVPKSATAFPQGVHTICGHGSPQGYVGATVHLYALTASMEDTVFYTADGELMFVPESGPIVLDTEFGTLMVEPCEIAVIPRGVKFSVQVPLEGARGYLLENFGKPFSLPDLGPIGANGLANPRDFKVPHASYKAASGKYNVINKFLGKFWTYSTEYHPLNVVAWHGNYVPYKYDLRKFNTMGTVSFDHPDPSIFTVLTSKTDTPGMANVDFVIFPERWMVAENTFRPPYYHRNLMSEYMGLIRGVYDAKPDGFVPGGGSLHNRMAAHGPDADTYQKASNGPLSPEKQENTLAFMWESSLVWNITDFALSTPALQKDYLGVWQGLKPEFK